LDSCGEQVLLLLSLALKEKPGFYLAHNHSCLWLPYQGKNLLVKQSALAGGGKGKFHFWIERDAIIFADIRY